MFFEMSQDVLECPVLSRNGGGMLGSFVVAVSLDKLFDVSKNI